MRNKSKFISDRAGFTLIELIVVIAILAILGGIGAVGYSAYVDRANRTADETLIHDIQQALIMGAYSSGNYTPSANGDWVSVGTDVDAEASNVAIEEMMVKTFGSEWTSVLRLKSDYYSNSDSSNILSAMKGVNKEYFGSVSNSSFYSKEGNTEAIVDDVDDIAAALNGYLDAMGNSNTFSAFWGDDFHTQVESGGLKGADGFANNNQMAANLTVFAAANKIAGEDDDWKSNWVTSWDKEITEYQDDLGNTKYTYDVNVSVKEGYVADLVMEYAQCVAVYNYAIEKYPRSQQAYKDAYEALENGMKTLSSHPDGAVNGFNDVLTTYWNTIGKARQDWQNDGQAATDAKAFIASMAAVNSLENTYVTKDKAMELNLADAFTNFGMANKLDTMVNYASMENLPDGECVIILTIAPDGTPVAKVG